MNRYKRMSGLLLVILVGACLNLKEPGVKINFYTLEYEPPRITGLQTLPVIIRLVRFSVAPSYNTEQMIYRDRSFRREADIYHQWRANPGDLVTYFLSRDMQQSGLFEAVLPYESMLTSSFVVEGSVDEFFEWDDKDSWKAVLKVNITLMAENEPDISKRVLFQKTYGKTESCKQKTPASLAGAMSLAMAEVSREIIEDIYSHLKARIKGGR